DNGETTIEGSTTTLAELEAVLREHLPYTREWREAWLKGKGWVLGLLGVLWYANGSKSMQTPVFTVHDLVGQATMGSDEIPLPDRPAFIAFVAEHTVKGEPDATPEERRAELEARGLKATLGGVYVYSRDGSS